jgi:tetratricopeptide (TPR) repeat protein
MAVGLGPPGGAAGGPGRRWYAWSVRLSPTLLLAATLALPALGCAHRTKAPVEVPTAPPVVENLDDLEVALNHYVLLAADHPARPSHLVALRSYLIGYLDQALAAGNDAEAEAALRYALALHTAADLRTSPPVPPLAAAAHRLYRRSARHGDELPSLLALAVEQRFGDQAMRERAVKDWQALEQWLVGNGPFASEPLLAHEDLERGLETVASTFPSPFVVQRLADLYVARYASARQAHTHGGDLGNTSARRMEITGYLLMRLYLRADDPKGAIAALGRVAQDDAVGKLRSIVEDAFASRRSARPLLSLAEQFVPEEDSDRSLPHVSQSWGIIDNLSRRALARWPKDAYVHLMRARVLRHEGLDTAALHHLRRSIELKDDVYEAWQELAQLEQLELHELARRDVKAALARLPEVEALHHRAMKLWRDRPVRPALPEAYFTVAEGLYQAGQVDEAQVLLDKSLAIEAQSPTLDLLGTIAVKRNRLPVAQAHYEELARLPQGGREAKLRWEARARGQLGEIALRRGDIEASTKHLRVALRCTNDLLGRPAMEMADQADRHLDRGHLLFLLGEVELALDDFELAAELAPYHVKAYADPMLQLVSYGYYREARSVFLRALEQAEVADSLKLYFSLWVNELALRQGLPPDHDAVSFLRAYAGDGWGERLARHASGELAYDELLEGARNDGERAEAFFYEGLRRWRAGDPAAGKKLLAQVVKTDLMGFFEYDMAQAYLAWDDLPTRARAPMPGGVAHRSSTDSSP